jgi:transcriptional regulator with GAF, ATPase, and Fis domain
VFGPENDDDPTVNSPVPASDNQVVPMLMVSGCSSGLSGQVRRAFALEGTVTIGRGAAARDGLALRDPLVSRLHATITPQNEDFLWHDLTASNRSWIGGRPATPIQTVAVSTPIVVGACFIVPRRVKASDVADISADWATPFGEFATLNPAMARLHGLLRSVVDQDIDLLLSGPTGVGKEVYASAIHRLSRRRGRFVAVNCASLTESLLDAELFGVRRGAFTGADCDRSGLVDEAEGGTLFLDEIGELSTSLQARLLRFLQERTYRRLGESRQRSCQVRVIAATNRRVTARSPEASFLRRDLLERFGPAPIAIPPLARRMEDLIPLSSSLLARFSGPLVIAPSALIALSTYSWPGNVRELAKVLQMAALKARGKPDPVITSGELPDLLVKSWRRSEPLTQAESLPTPRPRRRARPSRDEIEAALRAAKFQIPTAARLLGRARESVWRWVREENIRITGIE